MTRRELLFLGLIIIIYFLLRLPNLTLQPIFADEAIYIRWAQVMRAEPSLRFLPLSDGKTPLFMWLLIPFLKFISDPLLAGRLLSVFSGLATVIGCWWLGRKFFSPITALIVSFLVATTPYLVFFDRLALVDSMLAAFTVWTVFLSLWLVNQPRLDLAMLLGYSLGGGILTKTPGIFNFYLLFLSILTFNWSKRKELLIRVGKLLVFFAVAIVIGLMLFNILRLGPEFGKLDARNQDYIYPITRIWQTPLDPFVPHSVEMLKYFGKYLGPGLLFLLFIGLTRLIIEKNRLVLVLILWASIPIFFQLMLLKVLTARYLLFSIPLLLLIAAWGCEWLMSKQHGYRLILGAVTLAVLLGWMGYFDYQLLFNPERAPLPRNERKGYFEDWTAGYGLREIARYLEQVAKDQVIVVGTEGTFGTLPDGLQIYFDKNPRVIFMGAGQTVPGQLREAAKEHPAFWVANKSRYPQPEPGLILIQEYPKAAPSDPKESSKKDAILLFQLNPVK